MAIVPFLNKDLQQAEEAEEFVKNRLYQSALALQASGLFHEIKDRLREKLALEVFGSIIQECISKGYKAPQHPGMEYIDEIIASVAKLKPTEAAEMLGLEQANEEKEANKIVLASQIGEQTRQVLDKLTKVKDLNIYHRGSALFQVVMDETGAPILAHLTEDGLYALAADKFDFYKLKKKEDGWKEEPANPSIRIFKNIMNLSSKWRFPKITGVSSVPMVKPDGRVRLTSGYDPELEYYFVLDEELQWLDVPDKPTDEEVKEAVRILREELFADVLFKSEGDFANTLAFALSELVDPIVGFQEVRPGFLIDANKRGSGKGTLQKIISLLVYGVQYGVTPYPNREEEMEKQLFAVAMAGLPLVTFDNVRRKIASEALEAFITEVVYSGRKLNHSQIMRFIKRTIVVIIGNNVETNEDMATRLCKIMLETPTSRPDKRDFKKENILSDVLANRVKYLRALLILVKAWIAAGKPKPKEAPKNRFRQWSNVVGGILENAGIKGFWYEEEGDGISEEEYEWTLFLEHWFELLPNKYTVAELIKAFNPLEGDGELSDFLPSEIAAKLHKGFDETQRSVQTRIGTILNRKVDSPYGEFNYRLRKARDRKGIRYWVEADRTREQVQSENVISIHKPSMRGISTAELYNPDSPHYVGQK